MSWWNTILIIIVIIVAIAGLIETGTVFWLILPSDIILAAAVIALISLWAWKWVLLVTFVSILFTIIWDQIWYYSGNKLGSTLYDKKDTRYFKKKYLIQAQEALERKWEKFLYVWRFVSFWGLLPIIYGMMRRDKKWFFKVSALSAIIWKWSIILPLSLILFFFPDLTNNFVLLLLLAAAIPEIVGWIMLLTPEVKEYSKRLKRAKDQIDAIRGDIGSIKWHLGVIREKIKTNDSQKLDDQALVDLNDLSSVPDPDANKKEPIPIPEEAIVQQVAITSESSILDDTSSLTATNNKTISPSSETKPKKNTDKTTTKLKNKVIATLGTISWKQSQNNKKSHTVETSIADNTKENKNHALSEQKVEQGSSDSAPHHNNNKPIATKNIRSSESIIPDQI